MLQLVHRHIPPAGILVSAADPELLRDAIDAAMAAGIPVITIDSPLSDNAANALRLIPAIEELRLVKL